MHQYGFLSQRRRREGVSPKITPRIATLLLLACVSTASAQGESTDPGKTAKDVPAVSRAELSGNISVTWAPDIYATEDRYFVLSSGRGIALRVSNDLINWSRVDDALPGIPEWAKQKQPEAKSLWAPDLSYFNGQYQLYYAVSTLGSRQSAIGRATNRVMEPGAEGYAWQDRGKVIESFPDDNWNAIDANIVFDRQDRPWMSYGSYWSGLRIVRVDPTTGRPADGAERHRIAYRDIEGPNALEAPYIVRKHGYYYLFASFGWIKKNYEVRVGRSRDITGPYRDRQGRSMMKGGGTLVLTGYAGTPNPGHQAVLLDAEGRDWLLVRYLDPDHGGKGTMQLRQIVWDDEHWPLVGEPYSEAATRPVEQPFTKSRWKHTVDFSDDTAVTLRFDEDNRVTAGDHEGEWQRVDGGVRIQWHGDGGPSGSDGYTITVARNGRWYVARTSDGRIIRGIRLLPESAAGEHAP